MANWVQQKDGTWADTEAEKPAGAPAQQAQGWGNPQAAIDFSKLTFDQQQQTLPRLAQTQQQAQSTPTIGSGGTVLSPDPVERQRQGNQVWDMQFNAPKLTNEAKLASQGPNATNQWGVAGGVQGVDPAELTRLNTYRDNMTRSQGAYNRAREGISDPTASRQAGMSAISRRIKPGSREEKALIAQFGGVDRSTTPGGAFNPNAAVMKAEAVKPVANPNVPSFNEPVKTVPGAVPENAYQAGVGQYLRGDPDPQAQPTQKTMGGTGLWQDVKQGLSFIPNVILGAAATTGEAIGGKDIAPVNLQASPWANFQNMFNQPKENGVTVNQHGRPAKAPTVTTGPEPKKLMAQPGTGASLGDWEPDQGPGQAHRNPHNGSQSYGTRNGTRTQIKSTNPNVPTFQGPPATTVGANGSLNIGDQGNNVPALAGTAAVGPTGGTMFVGSENNRPENNGPAKLPAAVSKLPPHQQAAYFMLLDRGSTHEKALKLASVWLQ